MAEIMPKHIDHSNSETFEMSDLEKLIKQATNDLEAVDEMRQEEFKTYEMEKEYERRRKLAELDAMERKRAEEEYARQLESRKHHEKVNHPGSKDQLEEVWEEQDHLDGEQFNPKTFFQLHGECNHIRLTFISKLLILIRCCCIYVCVFAREQI